MTENNHYSLFKPFDLSPLRIEVSRVYLLHLIIINVEGLTRTGSKVEVISCWQLPRDPPFTSKIAEYRLRSTAVIPIGLEKYLLFPQNCLFWLIFACRVNTLGERECLPLIPHMVPLIPDVVSRLLNSHYNGVASWYWEINTWIRSHLFYRLKVCS